MNKISTILFILFSFSLQAQIIRPVCDDISQIPSVFTYSGFIIQDELTAIGIAQDFSLRFTITKGSPGGEELFTQNSTVPFSKQGYFTVEIGESAVWTTSLNNFIDAIQTSPSSEFYMNVSLRDNTGTYNSIGNQKILTVPYAYAANSIGGLGPDGAQGPLGPQGPQGLQGIHGVPGQNGTNGLDGAPGLQGVPGFGIMKMTNFPPSSGNLYVDDGTNTSDGQPHLRTKIGGVWTDL